MDRSSVTARTPAASYAMAAGAVVVAALLFQFAGKPFWYSAIDSDWARSRGLDSNSAWLREATFRRMLRSPRLASDAQLHQLYQLSARGAGNASSTLMQLGSAQGLPEDLVGKIVGDLAGGDDRRRTSIYLIDVLARSRSFDQQIEARLLDAGREGGPDAGAISALGSIGMHRPLSPATIDALLGIAEGNPSTARTALAALKQTATANGLPGEAVARITALGAEVRDPGAMNDALQILSALDETDDAMRILRGVRHDMIDGGVLAATMQGQATEALPALVADDSLRGVIRAAALTEFLAREIGPEAVGAAIMSGLASEDPNLRRAALASLPSLARGPIAGVAIDWPGMLAKGLGDPDVGVRVAAKESFRFAPLLPQEKTALQGELLASGTELQKLSVLQMLHSYEENPSQALREQVRGLTASRDPELATMAANVTQRWTPTPSGQALKKEMLSSMIPLLGALPVGIGGFFGL